MVPVTTKQFLCSLCFLTMNFARILHGESSGERSDSSPNAKKKGREKTRRKIHVYPTKLCVFWGPIGGIRDWSTDSPSHIRTSRNKRTMRTMRVVRAKLNMATPAKHRFFGAPKSEVMGNYNSNT